VLVKRFRLELASGSVVILRPREGLRMVANPI
jgi:hypothetical protein